MLLNIVYRLSYKFNIIMPRGGKRDGAGRPSVWLHKETKLIRVPIAISDQLMDIAHKLDRGEVLEFETNSKCVNQMAILDVPSGPIPLTFTQLAARLGCSTGTLHRHKKRGNHDLTPWSRTKDPDEWGWEFQVNTGKYHPV